MSTEKKTMFIRIANVLLFSFLLLSGCDKQNIDYGPCKFAPPESKFPLISSCEECFFNLKFQGKDYQFPGNKIASNVSGDYTQMNNIFLSFFLNPPDSDEKLYNSIGQITPLQKVEEVIKLNDSPPLVSTAFGIYNYCNDFFQPITGDISKSYHQITRVELIDSYPVEINSEPFQLFDLYLAGELQATLIINEETQVITAEYKVKAQIYAKL